MAGKGKKKRSRRERKARLPKKHTPVEDNQAAAELPEKTRRVEPEPAHLVEAEVADEDVVVLEEAAGGEVETEADTGESWGLRLRKGLSRSRKALSMPFTKAVTRKTLDPQFWLEAEEALIAADAGVPCANAIVEGAKKKILSKGIRDIDGIKGVFRSEVVEMLESFGRPPEPPQQRTRVLFVVGINGVGKTTTAAKIGYLMKEQGNRVLFAAADTFRAAGIEQMEMWAQRVGAPVVSHRLGGDPAAVAFDAVESAIAKGIDVVLVDTAGRLHTKRNLMEELAKMWRVVDRRLEGNPEAILVIDSTTGQNGVSQARVFSEALDVGSIALTKMDGSAKGGVVMAIGMELMIPVAYIGVGEGLSDLRPFDPRQYALALF